MKENKKFSQRRLAANMCKGKLSQLITKTSSEIMYIL